MDTDLDSLRAATKKIYGLVGSVRHAAQMAETGSTAAIAWHERRAAELHQAEDDLYALLEARRKAREARRKARA